MKNFFSFKMKNLFMNKLAILVLVLSALSFQAAAQTLNLDTSFGGVTDAAPQNYFSAVQADGKILVGGEFNFVNGTQIRGLARLNADGSLDTGFNAGGSGPNAAVNYILVLPDGKIIIGGTFTSYNGTAVGRLARLNTDGTLDSTFNPGGSGASGAGRIHGMALQPDGKILIAGQNITGYNGNASIGVFRVNVDGTFDNTFVSGFATNPGMEHIALQADGKILIAGAFTNYGGNTTTGFIRVNSNGSFDLSFPIGGDGGDAGASGMVVQPDGKIVIVGVFGAYNGTPRTNIVRVNADATLDTSFVPPMIAGGYFEFVSIQSDGKLVAAGNATVSGTRYPILRFNTNGSLDNSLLNSADSIGYSVSLQTDGKILLPGFFTNFATGGMRNGLARFNTDGSIDSAFTPAFTRFGTVNAITQQADGKVLVGGQFQKANGNFAGNIARFNADGTFDNTFATGTGTAPDPLNFSNQVNAIAVQADGKILVGGRFGTFNGSTQRVLVRLNANGSVDTTFNLSGDVNLDLIPLVEEISVLPDGKILVGGALRKIATGQARGFLQLNSDGSVDETFNGGGIGLNSTVYRILRQTDGKYIVVGQFTTHNGVSRPRIARINADGTLDASFTVGTGANSTVFDAALQQDGKIVIAGAFTSYNGSAANRIARINTDGTFDSSFNSGTGANSTVNSLTILANGKILIGGLFTTFNDAANNRLARLNANGSLDATFNSALDANTSSFVRRVAVQRDGKPLIGGTFVSYSGNPRNSLARLFTPEIGGGEQPLLFISTRDGNQEIYRMNADGTNQQRLTNTPENESGGFWSPDGQKIVFTRQVSSIVRQIWTMNADGSNPTLISPPTGFETVFRFSPNGQKILFARSTAVNQLSIWSMNADGTNRVQLTPTGSFIDTRGEWSPDSTQIIFTRCTPVTLICDIYKVNADGSNLVNLTPDFTENDDFPRWSSDGSKILFIRGGTASGYRDIFSMNADGSNVQRLTNTTLPTITADLIVSRNSNKAMFVRGQESPVETHEVFTMNTDGSSQINLTNNSLYDGISAWSPDNSKIAFISRREAVLNEIYIMNADGTQANRLTFNFANDFVTDWKQAPIKRAPFDFDGDGKTDIGIFRPSVGEWWINRSSNNSTFALQFGTSTDKIVSADFTGDGKTDVAFWRPSTGEWFVLRSEDSSFFAFPFGTAGDVPVPADYDGDGKADAAVFRESSLTWFIQKSSGGTDIIGFGAVGDKPVIGDYDGDGKADIAIFRPNGGIGAEWWIRRSSNGTVFALQFGAATDKAVQGDYTGDGKTDVAVWRPSNGNWFILRSEDFSFFAFPFGGNGDVPVPGDYDGDGKTDAGVFRPTDLNWYIQRSTQGTLIQQFGQSGDFPIPNAFVP